METKARSPEARVLEGKVALITGGNSGIGLATAALYAAQGAQVLVCGRSEETLAQADSLQGVTAIGADVSRQADRAALFSEVKSRFGRLDTVFTAAGVARLAAFEEQTPESFAQSFGINVEGSYFVVQGALPFLSAGSSVVFCGSVAGSVGCPFMSVYSATKAAVRSFARSLAVELAPKKIRVNCLSPGPTETPIHGKYGLDQARLEQASALVQGRLQLGRMAQAHEIAKGALFLASEASSFMTGQELLVDGGVSL
jgi:NAD(P)-dependent dehydrogenase (short-subunit alcohol dehydrogenase family)